jgi:threonine dehydratase
MTSPAAPAASSSVRFTATVKKLEAPPLEAIVKKILTSSVYEVARETPITAAPFLSARLGNDVRLKREDLQPVFSFKIRGAYNMMSKMSDEQKKAGAICASAGNHAQGVAISGKALGIATTIVMPIVTPNIKINAVRSHGANVILKGDTFDDALEHAFKLRDETGMTFVPPYDNIDVIAGQGTCGMEIIRQLPGKLDIVFVPVGGGGFIAGVASYIKYVRPSVIVIGVQSEDSAALKASLEEGRRVRLTETGVFADGVSVARIGENPWALIEAHDLVDDVVTCTTDEMCAAIKDIFEDTRAVAEPAGALSLAGLKKYVQATGITGKTLVAINSGANINFDRLQYICERTDTGEQREVLMAVTFNEGRANFLGIFEALGQRAVTEAIYRYSDLHLAKLFLGVRVNPGGQDRNDVLAGLAKASYTAVDLTDNDLAKSHVRYLGGGRGGRALDEFVYRFEFPERPGALLRFMRKLPLTWNITLVHYRNHGTAWASTLIGFEVPVDERAAVNQVLSKCGARCWNETENVSFKEFVKTGVQSSSSSSTQSSTNETI